MQTREADRQRRLTELLEEVFDAARVFQGSGQEVDGSSLAESRRFHDHRPLRADLGGDAPTRRDDRGPRR
jgi:hypothetical protein